MRQAARLLKINQITVARKMAFLCVQAERSHELRFRIPTQESKMQNIQFDEMESSIHTKCKPVSIALMVEEKSRKILDFRISEMPATGHLAAISRKKYGHRPDHREAGLNDLFSATKSLIAPNAKFRSDSKTLYPKLVRKFFPKASHEAVKGKRGCVVGQGELKKVVFDPIFSLNHTCAMLRAHVNRLFRRTWCTSKTIEGLRRHLMIYMDYHNQVLTQISI